MEADSVVSAFELANAFTASGLHPGNKGLVGSRSVAFEKRKAAFNEAASYCGQSAYTATATLWKDEVTASHV